MVSFFLCAVVLWTGCSMTEERRRPRRGGNEDPTTTTDTTTTPPDTPDDPTGPSEPTRRWDCAGLDPADPAPLNGKVALTFDDGPHPVHTASIVELLRGYNAPATFFVVGDMLSNPDSWDLVDDMVADPLFDIANHSWSHANLSNLNSSDRAEEYDDTTALIESFGISPAFFRFPFGASTCNAVDEARGRGMHITGWHVDTADWCYAAVGTTGQCRTDFYWRIPAEYQDDMLGFTMEQVDRFDGGVILLHDIHQYTADSLQALLDALDDGEYEIVPLSDVVAFPRLNNDDPADLPYLGEACSPQQDACWQIEYQSWCEATAEGATTGVCTIGCEGYCLDRPGAATTFCADVDPGAGQCVGRSRAENAFCAAVPGSTLLEADRWVGSSGASAAQAEVCAPTTW